MRKIIYFPIEEIPSRYGAGMNKVIMSRLTDDERSIAEFLRPWTSETPIVEGQFLDVVSTNLWKLRQMQLFLERVLPTLPSYSVLLIHDVFYPGLEALRYIFESRRVYPKIVAFNYAGRADKTDFVQKFGDWADSAEKAWHQCCDLVCVGSSFHERQVVKKFRPLQTWVTGYPFDPFALPGIRERVKVSETVAWPHRIAPEKDPVSLCEIADRLRSRTFLVMSGRPNPQQTFEEVVRDMDYVKQIPDNICFEHCEDKATYYQTLRRCDTFLATGVQETFGYALHEAAAYGLKLLCRKAACYPEMVPKSGIYSTVDDAVRKLNNDDVSTGNDALSQVYCGDVFLKTIRQL